jgi:hypothetical protein
MGQCMPRWVALQGFDLGAIKGKINRLQEGLGSHTMGPLVCGTLLRRAVTVLYWAAGRRHARNWATTGKACDER